MATLRFDKRMSDQDGLMWSIEKDPLLRSTITSVMLLDGAIDRERFGFGSLSGAASNVMLLSCVDELHIAVSTDPAAVPDPDTFNSCLEQGIDEIVGLAR